MAKGGDKLNSVALQLIIMPRLSLTDTGDLSRSHADTCLSSRSGSACARAKDTHGSTSPYPALAVDLDVLFTLGSVQRCHQVYLRAIFPFSAFTFFSFHLLLLFLQLPLLRLLFLLRPHSPLLLPSPVHIRRKGFKPSCAVFACTNDKRLQRDNARSP